MKTVTLFPAYGRKYLSTEAMLKDWNAGKDFASGFGGPYTSNREVHFLTELGFGEICLSSKDKLSQIRFPI